MEARTQLVPGYYVWEIPGKPIAVHLHLDVVDQLLAVVMRGYGAVPKRGAEVGGVLIGTVEDGHPSIVRVEDFEPVECQYRRGPSYLLVEADMASFEDACRRWRPDPSRPSYAVGYFRSHTRDGFSLSPEDVELLDCFFPSPCHLALLVRPFGTKVSAAGFFFREDGVFQESTPLEFPFRRRELAGEDAQPRRPMTEHRPLVAGNAVYDDVPAPLPGRRIGWFWIPLSFVFLLFGLALGLMIALTRAPGTSTGGARDFSLGLTVSRVNDNLNVKWDHQAPAVRTAPRGTLEIEDGSYAKSVDLDTAQLQNGSLIYRNSSSTVRFRLIVYPKARVSLAETMEWKQ